MIDALPKNEDGLIILKPAGSIDGNLIGGEVDPNWFVEHFEELAHSIVPLTEEKYSDLKSIGQFWATNAKRWRDQGII